jgi:ABC-type transport system involved in multi-copper enzyme maturation permease subunit
MSAIELRNLQSVKEKGWRRGLGNLLQGEYSAWFKSSRWWKHFLIWFAIINVMMAIMVIASAQEAKNGNEGPPLLLMYGIFGGLFVSFGVMIIMQQVLVREKRSGTAAWVLSKPVTRTAFVVSRLTINSIAILFTAVIVPGVITYLTLGLFGEYGWLSPFGFTAALVMISLNMFFWLALVLMMGTLSDSSSVVIAVPITLFFTFSYGTGLLPGLIYVSPLTLLFSPVDQIKPLTVSFINGEPVFSWLPLIATVIFSVIFIAVAIWRFNRQEF